MAKRLNVTDLKTRIEWALRQAKTTAPPIDLQVLCESLGIRVEWRWMIPEGVTAVQEDRVEIYLQSNFRDDPRSRRRQRFTWAHEICHALFYDGLPGTPRLLAGTPGGAVLEKLCQQGAGYLLMPSARFADDCAGTRRVSCLADLRSLSERYDVSEDVVLRRLHELNCVVDEYAIVLLRNRSGEDRIEAAAYGPWLQQHLPAPQVAQPFLHWAEPVVRRSVQISAATWTQKLSASRQLVLARKRRSGSSSFIEIRVESDGQHT